MNPDSTARNDSPRSHHPFHPEPTRVAQGRPGVADLRRFIALVRRTKPPLGWLLLALALSLASTATALTIPQFMKGLVNGFSHGLPETRQILSLGLAFAVQAAGSALSVYLLNLVGHRIVAGLRKLLWRKQLLLPVSFFDANESGSLVSRLTNDAAIIKTLVAENLSGLVSGLVAIGGAITIMLAMDWRMTAVMLAAVPLAMLVLMPIGRTLRRIALHTMDENARFTSVLTRVLAEVRLVKASNAEAREGKRGEDAIENLYRFGLQEARVMAVLGPLMSITLMAMLVVVVGYGGARVSSGAMSAGDLVAFILYLIQIIMPASLLTMFFANLQKTRGATESILEILDAPEEPSTGALIPPDQPGEMQFDDVTFAYGKGEPVLRGVSFRVEPGTVTALVGPSGSGKTTIFSLLERYYEPTGGSVRLDGVPAGAWSLAGWRRRLGYVSQDCPVMAGTVRDNIVYGVERDVSDEELEEAARGAHALEFISALPRGFDTDVGERGVKLSGGQRQRLAIARALLRDPAVLMLDEATSSLDSDSEHAVQQALANLMRGRTTLVIAHRLATVVNAHRILFLEGGVITGSGTHAELVRSHEMYLSFASRQLRAPAVEASSAA